MIHVDPTLTQWQAWIDARTTRALLLTEPAQLRDPGPAPANLPPLPADAKLALQLLTAEAPRPVSDPSMSSLAGGSVAMMFAPCANWRPGATVVIRPTGEIALWCPSPQPASDLHTYADTLPSEWVKWSGDALDLGATGLMYRYGAPVGGGVLWTHNEATLTAMRAPMGASAAPPPAGAALVGRIGTASFVARADGDLTRVDLNQPDDPTARAGALATLGGRRLPVRLTDTVTPPERLAGGVVGGVVGGAVVSESRPPRATEPPTSDPRLRRAIERLDAGEELALALADADALCATGDLVACNVAGTIRMQNDPAVADPVAGRAQFRRTCDAGSVDGCTRLAIAMARGLGGPKQTSEATALLRPACETDAPGACEELSRILLATHADPDETSAVLTRLCELGSATDCLNDVELRLISGRTGAANLRAEWLLANPGLPPELRAIAHLFRLRWCATDDCAERAKRALADLKPLWSWEAYLASLRGQPDAKLHAAVIQGLVEEAPLDTIRAAIDALTLRRTDRDPLAALRPLPRSTPRPAFPAGATAPQRCEVQVTVDPAGRVLTASAPDCPHPYRAAAESDARAATWAPVVHRGEAVRATFWYGVSFEPPAR